VLVLLDESLPRPLAREFRLHEVETVHGRGWAGLNNGKLLTQAAADFDVFVTADQNLRYQQNLRGFDIAVVVLVAPSNRLEALLPLMAEAEAACSETRPGEVRLVGPPPRAT
jgi:uncharacterized protein DUF5615